MKLGFFDSATGFLGAVTAGELLDAACSIDEFLFAGEEGMAGSADTDADIAFGGASHVVGSASAGDRRLDVVRMDVSFHKMRKMGQQSSIESGHRKCRVRYISCAETV